MAKKAAKTPEQIALEEQILKKWPQTELVLDQILKAIQMGMYKDHELVLTLYVDGDPNGTRVNRKLSEVLTSLLTWEQP